MAAPRRIILEAQRFSNVHALFTQIEPHPLLPAWRYDLRTQIYNAHAFADAGTQEVSKELNSIAGTKLAAQYASESFVRFNCVNGDLQSRQ